MLLWKSGSRLRRAGLSLLVFCVSLAIAVLMVKAVDVIAGHFMDRSLLPPHMGLIYQPDCEEHFESAEFAYLATINSLGLRNREVPLKKPENTIRIAVIGDSFTFGWGVNDTETWCYHLEELLKKDGVQAEVINVGKPGAGLPYYAEVAERAIPVLHPDVVIVGLLFDDIIDVGSLTTAKVWARTLERARSIFPNLTALASPRVQSEPEHMRMNMGGHIVRVFPASDNARTARSAADGFSPDARARFDKLEESVKKQFFDGQLNPCVISLSMSNAHYYDTVADIEKQNPPVFIPRVATFLRQIRRMAGDCGAKTLVVSIPLGPYVNREAWQNSHRLGFDPSESLLQSDGVDHSIERAATLADIPFLSVTHEFRKTIDAPGLYIPLDGHFSAKGHAQYAESLEPKLLDWLRKNK